MISDINLMAIYKKYGEDDILKALKNIETAIFCKARLYQATERPLS